uniref:Putative secreted protein n=1 Tax=Ixodes ricinus TaxID=34613 RepID=A0A6B0U7U5_IXORI
MSLSLTEFAVVILVTPWQVGSVIGWPWNRCVTFWLVFRMCNGIGIKIKRCIWCVVFPRVLARHMKSGNLQALFVSREGSCT